MKTFIKNVNMKSTQAAFFLLTAAYFIQTEFLYSQSVVGVIDTTIGKMVTILNILIVGVMAWSGFLLARGDGSAVQKIIYGIIGLIVVNSARVIIQFFFV